MDPIERYTHKVATLLLVLLGVASVAIAVGDLSGLAAHLVNKPIEEIVLGVVGVLCLAIGLERVVESQRYERRLGILEDTLKRLAGGVQLNSHDEIYDSATRLCGQCGAEYVPWSSLPDLRRQPSMPRLYPKS